MRNHIAEKATCRKHGDVNGGSKNGSNLSFLSLHSRKSEEAMMKTKFAPTNLKEVLLFYS